MIVNHAGIARTITESLTQGNYVTGDPWIVLPSGTATLTALSPGHELIDFEDVMADVVQNGSMLNPVPETAFCFTNAIQVMAGVAGPVSEYLYDADFDVAANLPVSLVAGDILVSSITHQNYNPNGGGTGLPGDGRNTYPDFDNSISVYSPLCVVAAAPSVGSFRPGLYGTSRKAFNVSDVDYSVISDHWVAPVTSTPTLAEIQTMLPSLCWLEWSKWSGGGAFLGSQNTATALTDAGVPSTYGRDIAEKWSKIALYLATTPETGDEAAWEALVNQVIQVGLDTYHYFTEGGELIANGAQKVGRKFPLFVAAICLGDVDLLAMASDPTLFPEDQCTFIVQTSDIGRVVNAPRVTYGAEHVGLGEWGQSHLQAPENDDSRYDALYRTANWPMMAGAVLFTRLIGQEIAWGHPPIFAYTERLNSWVAYTGYLGEMWSTYYPTLPPIRPAAATFSIAARIVKTGRTVALSSATAGATIFYSTTGEASAASTPYTGPITLTADVTIYVFTSHVDYPTGSHSSASFQVITGGSPAPPSIS